MNLNREDEFLKDQANQAWAAMGNTFAHAADQMHPRHWKARTWWIALGVTAAAGALIVGTAVRRHWAPPAPRQSASSPPPEPKHHRIAGIVKLVLELASIARPLLQSVFAGFVPHANHDGPADAAEPASPPPRSV